MLSPYNIESFENGLLFITDAGIEYRAVFEKHTAFYELGYQSFEFSFYPVGNRASFFDGRIRESIFKVLQDFLNSHPDCVLLYICDSLDNQARARNILFNRWFREIAGSDIFKINRKIIDTDLDLVYYVAFIFNKSYIAENILEPYIDLEVQNLSK